MTEFIILDAGGVLVAPRMGDWLTPVRFEEIIGETRLAAVSKKQLKRAMEESARVYLDESLLLPDETWEFAARRNYFVGIRPGDWAGRLPTGRRTCWPGT